MTQQFLVCLTDKMTTSDKEVVCRLKELKASKKMKDVIETAQPLSEKIVEEGRRNGKRLLKTPK